MVGSEAGEKWTEYAASRLLSRNRLLLRHHRLLTEFLLDFFSQLPVERSCLDIGCGSGYFLELLRDLGFENISGLDASAPFVGRAREKGLNVTLGNLYDLDECEARYDMVLLLDVLEHLDTPAKALQIIHGLLTEGGLLVLNAPVCDSFAKRARRLLLGETKLQQMQKWDETHLLEFSARQLKKLVAQAGFSVEKCVHVSNPFPGARWICEKLAGLLQAITFGGRFGDLCCIIARK